MLLAIDIGNTNITLGIFEEERLISKKYIETNLLKTVDEYKDLFKKELSDYKFNSCIISSVVPELDKKMTDVICMLFEVDPVFINSNLNLGFKIKSEHPETAGADRIANAVYASKKCPKPTIIIDAGSAITFDVIDKNCDFIGGLIMPGIKLQLKALHDYTSKLPIVDIKPIDKIINNDTENSILSGVIRGTACAVEGLIQECTEELGTKPYVVLTGGNANLITKYISRYDEINQNLTLEGICIINSLL